MARLHPSQVPLIDVSPLIRKTDPGAVAKAIDAACRELGFFYIVGHGVDLDLQKRLETASREFFAREADWKMRIAMSKGGKAWRGYFPVAGELTSGTPDLKEGIYFGEELSQDHPEVRAGTPLHGQNLFPEGMPELRKTVLQYLGEMTRLGHHLMEGIALALGLDESYFRDRYTSDPLVLFRIFHYPAAAPSASSGWGVGEHTDYGVLTILKQDDRGGLEVKTPTGWTAAPPIENSFVCNLGDMLDRMTAGLYRSTPHRVRNTSGKGRLSFPFFFDPNFHADVRPIELTVSTPARDDRDERWDRESVHAFQGTYGEYLMRKIGKVFPDLGGKVLK
jgi:isopenicillin N synthase-like dioxygenase